jgi:hypothetical protein
MGLGKMAPRDSLGCSRYDGVRTRPTWLGMTAAAGTGRLGRGIADCLVWCLPLCAGLELAEGDNLVPGPDSDDEGVGAAVQDGIGTIIGPLQGYDDAAAVNPDEGGTEEVPRKLLWQQAAQVVLDRQRNKKEHLGFWNIVQKFYKWKTLLPAKTG